MTHRSWDEPWEHPDWYDLHDTAWTAGPDREPEHYRELVIALPPLDFEDHVVDVGAGTGKVACAIGRAYPRLGKVSLIEPNDAKLERAEQRLRGVLPNAEIRAYPLAVGRDSDLPKLEASIATIGSVFMPLMELWSGSLGSGLDWLRSSLEQVAGLLRTGGVVFDAETLAPPWVRGNLDGPSRRLHMREFRLELEKVMEKVEIVYRFRDRVVVRAEKAST
ncbi:MAG TPA: hypothetical protein VLK65_12700 [Vicinamibacteria bacterium]|nr:hypothetical protein [Vicinamibacteria bacterium]